MLQRSLTAPASIASPAGRTPTHPAIATSAPNAGAVPGDIAAFAEENTASQNDRLSANTSIDLVGEASSSRGDKSGRTPEALNPTGKAPQLEKSLEGGTSTSLEATASAALRVVTPLVSDAAVASRAAPGLERATSMDDRLSPLFQPPRRALYGPTNDPTNTSISGSSAVDGDSGSVTVATRHGGSRQGSPRFAAGSRGRGSSNKHGSGSSKQWNGSTGRTSSSLADAFEPTPMELWLEIPVGDEHFTVCRLWAPPREALSTEQGGGGRAGAMSAVVELDEGRGAASWVRDLALEFGLSPAEEAEVWGSVRRQVSLKRHFCLGPRMSQPRSRSLMSASSSPL